MLLAPMSVGETSLALQALQTQKSRYEPVNTLPAVSHDEGARLITEALAGEGTVGEVTANAINIQIRKKDDYVEMVKSFRF